MIISPARHLLADTAQTPCASPCRGCGGRGDACACTLRAFTRDACWLMLTLVSQYTVALAPDERYMQVAGLVYAGRRAGTFRPSCRCAGSSSLRAALHCAAAPLPRNGGCACRLALDYGRRGAFGLLHCRAWFACGFVLYAGRGAGCHHLTWAPYRFSLLLDGFRYILYTTPPRFTCGGRGWRARAGEKKKRILRCCCLCFALLCAPLRLLVVPSGTAPPASFCRLYVYRTQTFCVAASLSFDALQRSTPGQRRLKLERGLDVRGVWLVAAFQTPSRRVRRRTRATNCDSRAGGDYSLLPPFLPSPLLLCGRISYSSNASFAWFAGFVSMGALQRCLAAALCGC